MTALVNLPFASTFVFSRPVPGDCRDAAGEVVTRAANVPRFDHSAAGDRRGLLIAPAPVMGEDDALRLADPDWAAPDPATVLVEWEESLGDAAGTVYRRASFTYDPRAAAEAAMRIGGRLRKIAVVRGFLPNLAPGGSPAFVRYRSLTWGLGAAIAVSATQVLGDGETRAMIESS